MRFAIYDMILHSQLVGVLCTIYNANFSTSSYEVLEQISIVSDPIVLKIILNENYFQQIFLHAISKKEQNENLPAILHNNYTFIQNDLQLTLFHVLRTKILYAHFHNKSFNMISNNNAQQFFSL